MHRTHSKTSVMGECGGCMFFKFPVQEVQRAFGREWISLKS